ncbi:TPA: hypothetical protein RSW61_001915 [Vibrio harveyi]|nr:hypothetical protein [Vibrio harveyi]
MNNVPEDKLIVYYDEEFKNRFIEAIVLLHEELEGFEFHYTVDELRESVIDDEENPIDADSIEFSIDPDEVCDVSCDAFFDWGDTEIKQSDLVTFLEDISGAELYDNLEYYSSSMYLHRVAVNSRSEDTYIKLLMLDTVTDGLQVYFSSEASFHFSVKLAEQGHKEPVEHDSFVVIRGENLNLEQCRKIFKSYVFEASSVANARIESYPNEPFDIDDHLLEEEDGSPLVEPVKRQLIVCDDTDKVISLYNKAMVCDDDEVAILFYSKVIEFVSETVVRTKVTDEARKVLSSNRALTPDANFIKELQELFKEHSYQKDSDSLKLAVQTCGYFRDLDGKVPEFIKSRVKSELKKGGVWGALGTLADSITATRNSIAHAKANYKITGKEIPEEQYDQLSELLRVLSQQCIRWYAAQSPLVRVK